MSGPPPSPSSSPPPPPLPPNAAHPHPHSLRLKRAVLAAAASASRRGCGPSTPASPWKLLDSPFYQRFAMAAATAQQRSAQGRDRGRGGDRNGERGSNGDGDGDGDGDAGAGVGAGAGGAAGGGGGVHGRHLAVSARKLAASLWELSSADANTTATTSLHTSPRSHLQLLPSPISAASSDSPQTMKCGSIHQACKPADFSKKGSTKVGALSSPHAKEIAVMHPNSSRNGVSDRSSDARMSQSNAPHTSPLGMNASNQSVTMMDYFKLEAAAVTSPKDLVRAFNRIKYLEEKQNSNISVVAGLRMELEHAHARVQELELAQKSARKEIDNLLKKVVEERAMLRSKEQERIQEAIQSVTEEMEGEKKYRKRLEMHNKKLTRDLSAANRAMSKAVQELEKERKARELMEDVCDELAKEIGEDKAEVEQLKKEHAKIREEMEEERKMLQMAEVWREERVQMKLADARLELEDKSLALDKLRTELDAFLSAHRTSGISGDSTHDAEHKQAIELQSAAGFLLHQAKDIHCHFPEVDDAGSIVVEPNEDADDGRSECSVDPRTQLYYDDKNWESKNFGPPSKGRRHYSGPESHGSEAEGLDRLWNRKLDGDRVVDDESNANLESQNEGTDEWEYASERKDEERGASDWSADCDENGDEKDEDSPWNSENEVGEILEDGSDSSPGLLARQAHGSRVGDCPSNGGVCSNTAPGKETALSMQKHLKNSHTPVTQKFAVNSPVQQPLDGNSSLGSRSQEGSQSSSDASGPHVTRDMKGFIKWPKGFRNNSLQAKLLEARMEGQKVTSRCSRRMKSKN